MLADTSLASAPCPFEPLVGRWHGTVRGCGPGGRPVQETTTYLVVARRAPGVIAIAQPHFEVVLTVTGNRVTGHSDLVRVVGVRIDALVFHFTVECLRTKMVTRNATCLTSPDDRSIITERTDARGQRAYLYQTFTRVASP